MADLKAPRDPEDCQFEQVELLQEAKALTDILEDLIVSSGNDGTDPNAPDGLKQKQYACIRSLQFYLAEVEALSAMVAGAVIAKGKGDGHA
jgi:hypothetical protein